MGVAVTTKQLLPSHAMNRVTVTVLQDKYLELIPLQNSLQKLGQLARQRRQLYERLQLRQSSQQRRHRLENKETTHDTRRRNRP